MGHSIVNPLSGERIVVADGGGNRAGGNGGPVLAWELFLAPGGRVPNSHVHPLQTERFRVLTGRVRFRVGWRRLVAGPGDAVRVAPGRVHHFANAGPEEAHLWVETEPALAMVPMFEAAAALAQDRYEAGRRLPRLVDLALFMREFEREVQAPYVPMVLVSLLTRPIAWLARSGGIDARYRRLRGDPGPSAGGHLRART